MEEYIIGEEDERGNKRIWKIKGIQEDMIDKENEGGHDRRVWKRT